MALALVLTLAGCSFDAGGYGLHLDAGADIEGVGGEVAGDPVDAPPAQTPDASEVEPPEELDAGVSDPPDEACGDEGEVCCPTGEPCDDGTECSSGICESCGGVFESCCDPGGSCSGLQICVAGGCV